MLFLLFLRPQLIDDFCGDPIIPAVRISFVSRIAAAKKQISSVGAQAGEPDVVDLERVGEALSRRPAAVRRPKTDVEVHHARISVRAIGGEEEIAFVGSYHR